MPTAVDVIDSDMQVREHWVKRVLAGITDGILTLLMAGVLLIPLIIMAKLGFFVWYYNIVEAFMWGLIYWLYSAGMEARHGATVGKQFFGLKVTALQGEMTGQKAMTRNLSKLHVIFFVFDIIAGAVSEGDPRQRYMDRVAGTTVATLHPAPTATYQSPTPPVAPRTAQPPQPPAGQAAEKPREEPPVYQYETASKPVEEAPKPQECGDCGGRLMTTGDGRRQCIRCGKVT
ncbi:MAG: RDD family protein [Euryarchaeota archaeon]|nr:RDD family protein [Euryarchaeota archaeon]